MVHTFHEEMPKQDIKNYIKSFLKYLKINLVLILNIKEPELLGEGWENNFIDIDEKKLGVILYQHLVFLFDGIVLFVVIFK